MSIEVLVSTYDGVSEFMGNLGMPTGVYLGERELCIGDVVHVNESEKNVDFTSVICILNDRIGVRGIGNSALDELDITHVVIPYSASPVELNAFLEQKNMSVKQIDLSDFFKKYTSKNEIFGNNMFGHVKEHPHQWMLVNIDHYEVYGLYGMEVGVSYKGQHLRVGDELDFVVNAGEVHKGVIALQGNVLTVIWLAEEEPVLIGNPIIYIYSSIEGGLRKYDNFDLGLEKLEV